VLRQVPSLRPSIRTLLKRCQDDDDDEVRDRATLYLQQFDTLDETPASADGAADAVVVPSSSVTSGRLPMTVQSLVKALHLYQLRPTAGAVTFDSLPHVDGRDGRPFGYEQLLSTEAPVAGVLSRCCSAVACRALSLAAVLVSLWRATGCSWATHTL
jgi:hypothetical protein